MRINQCKTQHLCTTVSVFPPSRKGVVCVCVCVTNRARSERPLQQLRGSRTPRATGCSKPYVAQQQRGTTCTTRARTHARTHARIYICCGLVHMYGALCADTAISSCTAGAPYRESQASLYRQTAGYGTSMGLLICMQWLHLVNITLVTMPCRI